LGSDVDWLIWMPGTKTPKKAIECRFSVEWSVGWSVERHPKLNYIGVWWPSLKSAELEVRVVYLHIIDIELVQCQNYNKLCVCGSEGDLWWYEWRGGYGNMANGQSRKLIAKRNDQLTIHTAQHKKAKNSGLATTMESCLLFITRKRTIFCLFVLLP